MIHYGKGVFLYDHEGKDYLDACSGAITVNIGHGVDEVKQAMVQQADQVSFVYRSQFTSEAAEGLADRLKQLTSKGLSDSFFVNSGSEATETAMKIALQHWQEKGQHKKMKIISRWMSYHGITLGALSMSGHTPRRERFTSLLESYPSVSPPYCYRCPYHQTYPNCQLQCAQELQTVINRLGKENVAAFICEPVIGAAGAAISPPPGYMVTIKQICEKNDILFIVDEVMTGVGRTGKMLACEHDAITADLVTLGKGISGGYTPIAATIVSEKVMQPIEEGSGSVMSGHTFSANPLSCAVAGAVIDYIEKNKVMEKVETKGQYLRKALERLQIAFPFIGDVRGKGLLLGLEFVQDAAGKTPFSRSLFFTKQMVETAQRHGLLLYPAQAGIDGVEGDAVIIAPPLTITNDEMDELLNRLKRTLTDMQEYILMKGEGYGKSLS